MRAAAPFGAVQGSREAPTSAPATGVPLTEALRSLSLPFAGMKYRYARFTTEPAGTAAGPRQSLLAVHDRSRVRVRRSCGRSWSSAAGLRSSAARWFAPTLSVVNELSEPQLDPLIPQSPLHS